MLVCSIGIIVYNEEKNIGRLLDALLRQELHEIEIAEIVVVSSACRDRTDDIVRDFARRDPRIRLIEQKEREGKSSAINLWLQSVADGVDVCVMESGDTIPQSDTVEKLVLPFRDLDVGMTGAHPIPVNSPDTFIGFAVHLLWRLHHEIALESPKLGEMVAFRNVVSSIPPESAVDEASIEVAIRKAGLRLVYVPEAYLTNKGPENVRDFFKQRRRIAAGHLWLREHYDYHVSTQSPGKIFSTLLRCVPISGIRDLVWMAGTIFLEGLARLVGKYDYCVKKKNPFKWEIAESTKEVIKH